MPALIRITLALLASAITVCTAVAEEPQAMMAKPAGDIEEVVGLDHGVCMPDGIAVGGFDLVSYRQDGGPLQGEPGLAVDFDGARYLFISEENRQAFEASPEKYLPRYGGWCAVTLALGRLTCPDYTNFQIENDELLLFETTGFTNGRVLWNTDAAAFRKKADDNYTKLNRSE